MTPYRTIQAHCQKKFSHELQPASRIDLDRQSSARQLLNLLRARTFPGYPACHFEDKGEMYEVRVDIRRLSE